MQNHLAFFTKMLLPVQKPDFYKHGILYKLAEAIPQENSLHRF